MRKLYKILTRLFLFSSLLFFAQAAEYNHPELKWTTFETEHFVIHYHNGTEWTAKEAARVAETIYPLVTGFYDFEPSAKTDLIIKDTDDIANGAAYYFDNKIDIWASPLDFELRGAHRWLRNVVTHEFTHIVSLQKAMKTTRNIPGIYFQAMAYEPEKREDVVRGYPNVIISYPFPTVTIPMWLAEGVAQYQYPGSTNDNWDSHRDMIIRDRVFHDKLFTFKQMESFGKPGIGSESVYNQGFGLTHFIAEKYGTQTLPQLMDELAKPLQYSIDKAMKKATGKSGEEIWLEWKNHLTKNYYARTEKIRDNLQEGEDLLDEGISQLYPFWNAEQDKFYYVSSKGTDYFSLTSLYIYDFETKEQEFIQPLINSKVYASRDGKTIFYSKKSNPNKRGSVFNNIYKYNLETKKKEQITKNRRAKNPVLPKDEKDIYYVVGGNGQAQIVKLNLESKEEFVLTDFDHGIQVHNLSISSDEKFLAFDMTVNHGRNIALLNLENNEITSMLSDNFDERDPFYSPDGKWLYYSADRTGIFNIYRKSLIDGKIEQVTNVTGGAFMPAVNEKEQLVFSKFDDAKYKIAYLDKISPVNQDNAKYINDYEALDYPMLNLTDLGDVDEHDYKQKYSKVFVLPKLMLDYGTLKPGFYFFTSEVLNQFNLFGGASINKNMEHDVAFLLEYKKLEPTLFLEYYDISRGLYDKTILVDGHPGIFDYHFHMQQLILGATRAFSRTHNLRFDASIARYASTADQSIPDAEIYSNGFTYDYYQGVNFMLTWDVDGQLPSVNSETNPDNGFELKTIFYRNYDKFLDEFGINKEYGTLKEVFRKNYYWKLEHQGKWHHKIMKSHLVGNLGWQTGFITKPDIDSFFNLFAGGMPGLRGYPYFALEGRNLFKVDYTFRYPLFKQKNIKIGPFNLQNGFIGTFIETGNAWSKVDGYEELHLKGIIDDFGGVTKNLLKDFKSDAGVELRFSGFSFYGYPTAIKFDVAYGFNEFIVIDSEDKENVYGNEVRTYLTILFGL